MTPLRSTSPRSKFGMPESISTDDEAERLAKSLERHSNYRVLRELDANAGIVNLPPLSEGEKIGLVLDIETTGLDYSLDRPIEISIQRFIYNEQGIFTNVERPRSWFEDPGSSLPPLISKLTGIMDTDLIGQAFDEPAIVAVIAGSDIVIAHNARFDRPFIDRRFPSIRDNRWACSLTQIDWLELGFDGRSLGYLVMQAGWFFRGHRAQNDVIALTALLDTVVADDRTILSHLLKRSDTDTLKVDAVNAPFSAKDMLKGNGYRWNVVKRVWWKEIQEAQSNYEIHWLDQHVYQGRGAAALQRMTARDRFRNDL